MKRKPWIAFFSQTGSELYQVCESLNIWPDAVVTNAAVVDNSKWQNTSVIHINKSQKITSDTYFDIFKQYISTGEEAYITLHGWLKIIPKDVCERYTIFNGHPGDIIKYPELKGKDPQQKSFDLKLKTSGCIIHRVIAEVDSGPVISRVECDISDCKTVEEIIDRLKKISVNMWKEFIKSII